MKKYPVLQIILFAFLIYLSPIIGQVEAHEYPFSNCDIQNISNMPGGDIYPSIDGNNVVWNTWNRFSYKEESPYYDNEGDLMEIYFWDGNTTQLLTDTAMLTKPPQISGGNAVWQSNDGNDEEIYFWDGNTVQQLTDNDTDDISELIDGDHVVWRGWDGTDYEIYLWDGNSIQQITDNDSNDNNVQISGNNLAWQGWDGADYEIYFWNGNTVQQVTDNDSNDSYIQMSGNNLAWLNWDGNDFEVYFWDGNATQQLSDNDTNDTYMQISGNNVVWNAKDGNDLDVFFWDGSTVQQLTHNDKRDVAIQITGDKIVWIGLDGNDWEIFFWDGSTVQQLTHNDRNDVSPQISGDMVVWRGYREYLSDWYADEYEIYFWDGNRVQMLTDDGAYDGPPQISDGKIVWHSYKGVGNSYEIMFLDTSSCGEAEIPELVLPHESCYIASMPYSNHEEAPQVSGHRVAWSNPDGNDYEIYLWDGVMLEQLTDNDALDRSFQLSGDTIAWAGHDGNDYEIYLRNGDNVQQITNNDTDDNDLQLSGNKIAWSGWDGNDYEIYFWDGNNIQQISNNDEDDWVDEIVDNRIIWRNRYGTVIYYLWDGSTNQQLPEGFGIPQIIGNDLVFRKWIGSYYELYLWDGNGIQQLEDKVYGMPYISANNMVWAGWDGNDYEIYFWDGNTIQQITDNDIDDRFAQISDDKLVWVGDNDTGAAVYLWDGNSIQQVIDYVSHLSIKQVTGGYAVWDTHVNGRSSGGEKRFIYFWDGTTTFTVDSNNFNTINLVFDGTTVVWTGMYQDHIQLAAMFCNFSLEANANGSYTVNEGDSVLLTGTGTDDEAQELSYRWDLDHDGTFETSGNLATFSALDGPDIVNVPLQVCDPKNHCVTDTAEITINNLAPTATLSSIFSTSILEGGDAAFSVGNISDPSVVDMGAGIQIAYDCHGDGTYDAAPSSNTTFTCIYPDAGIFNVIAQVTDKDGASSTTQLQVEVITAEEAVGIIGDVVLELPLNNGQINALMGKLDNIKTKIENGQLQTAVKLLDSFINQVQSMIDTGKISPDDGNMLINLANSLKISIVNS